MIAYRAQEEIQKRVVTSIAQRFCKITENNTTVFRRQSVWRLCGEFIHHYSRPTTVGTPAVKHYKPEDETPDDNAMKQVHVNQISEEHKVSLHADSKPACNREGSLTMIRLQQITQS